MHENLQSQESAGKYEFVREIFQKVKELYGSGDPADEPGILGDLPYHNFRHANDVAAGALQVAGCYSELSKHDLLLVATAAAAHDLMHKVPWHEQVSATLLTGYMRVSGHYSEEDIETCRLAILGTQVTHSQETPGLIVGQLAATQSYPSRRAELLAKCVASGDFATLYTSKGPSLAHDLYHEQEGMCIHEVPSMTNFQAFQFRYLQLLWRYTYPLPTAEQLLTHKKQAVIDNALDLLLRVRSGEIQTWGDVVLHDRDFLQRAGTVI